MQKCDVPQQFFLPDENATDRLGRLMAEWLVAKDTVLLTGHIGAGKSHFARAFIRSHFGPHQEVPSPSFTLVQTYENDAVEVWHVDLYRLGHPDEVSELGLLAAMEHAICLIEWPERMGSFLPERAISLTLTARDDGREAVLFAPNHPHLIDAICRAFMS